MRTKRTLLTALLLILSSFFLASCAQKGLQADEAPTHHKKIEPVEEVSAEQAPEAVTMLPAEDAEGGFTGLDDALEPVTAEIAGAEPLPDSYRLVSAGEKAETHAAAAEEDATSAVETGAADTPSNYKVELGTDPLIVPGQLGLLKVWIGDEQYNPNFSGSMVTATATLPANGKFAKVAPYTTAQFIEIADSDPRCIKINPAGSTESYTLKPLAGLQTGQYTVGADVDLHYLQDCSDSPTPYSPANVQVDVTVMPAKQHDEPSAPADNTGGNPKPLPEPGLAEKMLAIVEEKFLLFFGALAGLFFTVIYILINRKVSGRFDIQPDEANGG